jgi:hypothetical protein
MYSMKIIVHMYKAADYVGTAKEMTIWKNGSTTLDMDEIAFYSTAGISIGFLPADGKPQIVFSVANSGNGGPAAGTVVNTRIKVL